VTPEQITLVERTLTELTPRLDALAIDFYRRLFAADPALPALFSTDPAEQRTKFVAELNQIIRSIRDHPAFLDRATHLGAEHDEYGVRPRHYRAAGVALLDALAATLGDRWTVEAAEAWAGAYDLTTAAMLAGGGTLPAELSVSRRGGGRGPGS
jgi:nitric oxide dioxygenase